MNKRAQRTEIVKRKPRLQISGNLLARNALLNFVGQAVPLIAGVVTIPFIVRELGTERFGLLSLAWVVLGYFSIFDLGLGRATTKFVAEALGKGQEGEIPRIVWTAVTVQALLGVVGTFSLAGITPLLVERILNIPPELANEARTTFYILALSVPVILVSGSFRGVLEAAQRFDLVNAVKVPISVLTFLLPLLGLLLGLHLPGIVALILVARVGALAAFVMLNFWISPRLRRYSSSFALFPHLFSFGGWITVSSIVGPILVYLDRFLVGSLLSIEALSYYSAPFEAVTRLRIISSSLMMVLFPAFSALKGLKDGQRLGALFARSIKYVLLTLGPVILVITLFARETLQVWLGSEFALRSTLALQILALGVLINSLAHAPFALLQGIGRPDLPAKFHMLEVPIYVGIAWFLITQEGIVGAAGAWTLRAALDAILLHGAAFKVCGFPPRLLVTDGTAAACFVLLIFGSIFFVLKNILGVLSLLSQALLVIILLGLFMWLAWKSILDKSEREVVLKMMKLWKR